MQIQMKLCMEGRKQQEENVELILMSLGMNQWRRTILG